MTSPSDNPIPKWDEHPQAPFDTKCCTWCGACVIEEYQVLHEEFHREIVKIAAMARHGDNAWGMMRPLG